MPIANAIDDAELVARSLNGDKDAFGELVFRYQSPLCALTYSGCGDVFRSEDLAQEAFLIAWRKLGDLDEPSKFKPWLLGIARNLVRTAYRNDTRDSLAGVEPLQEQFPADHQQFDPAHRAMAAEEHKILWRTLEQIPAAYREPLVLFYREHESIERVAQVLDLSEDAIRQRLSRGRKLLHGRLIAFVENSLRETAPGPAFALTVTAALQQITAATASSAVASTAIKGHVVAKTGAALGFFSIAKIIAGKVFPAAVGTWLMLKIPDSKRERRFAILSWLFLWICSLLYVAGLYLAETYANRSGFSDAHPKGMTLAVLACSIGFIAFVMPYTFWMAKNQRRIRREEKRSAHSLAPGSLPDSYEYKSPWHFLGLPLVHICWNPSGDEKSLAIGWIACGQRAVGILFASGTFAVGAISCGAVSIGLIGIGGFGIGLFAFGGMAVGLVAIGGLSIGYLAFGGVAIAWKAASGGAAIAKYIAAGGGVIAAHANDRHAYAYLQRSPFFRNQWTIFNILIVLSWLVPGITTLCFKRFLKRKHLTTAAQS